MVTLALRYFQVPAWWQENAWSQWSNRYERPGVDYDWELYCLRMRHNATHSIKGWCTRFKWSGLFSQTTEIEVDWSLLDNLRAVAWLKSRIGLCQLPEGREFKRHVHMCLWTAGSVSVFLAKQTQRRKTDEWDEVRSTMTGISNSGLQICEEEIVILHVWAKNHFDFNQQKETIRLRLASQNCTLSRTCVCVCVCVCKQLSQAAEFALWSNCLNWTASCLGEVNLTTVLLQRWSV